jgi:hypothetical protein
MATPFGNPVGDMFLLPQYQSIAIYRFDNPFANIIAVSLRDR